MGSLGSLGDALKVAAIIEAVHKYTEVVDEVKQANAQLKLATRSADDLATASQRAFQIAQQQGVSYGSIAELLAKAGKAANNMGITAGAASQIAADATASVAAGVKASGIGAQQASAGILQLTQGLGAGVLQGQDLKALLEDIPAVGQAIADAMGLKGGAGALRQMGTEGKLTSKYILEGLAKARPQLEALAAMVPLTFGAAFEKVKNSFAQLLYSFDQDTSLGAGIIKALDLVSRAMDLLVTHAQAVSNIVVGVLVAVGVKSALAFSATAKAAAAAAAEEVRLAAAANVAAIAEQRQAVASLAVARAMVAQGAAAEGIGIAAAGVVAASAKVAETAAVLETVTVAEAAAAGGATLFGRAWQTAAKVINLALESIGGGMGLLVIGLIAATLYLAKLSLAFKPIKGSAAEVRDYVGAAFDVMGEKIGAVIDGIGAWWDKATTDWYEPIRGFIVQAIDIVMSIVTPVAEVVAGVTQLWIDGQGVLVALWAGIYSVAKDAFEAIEGPVASVVSAVADWFKTMAQEIGSIVTALVTAVVDWFNSIIGPVEQVANTVVGFFSQMYTKVTDFFQPLTDVAKAVGHEVGGAFATVGSVIGASFEKGAGRAKAAMAGVTGEKVVSGVEAIPAKIGDALNASGLRERAEARAAARAAGDKGGLGVGSEPEEKKKEKKKGYKANFPDILKQAQEEAQAASLTTAERERQQAVLQAQKTLHRDLTTEEAKQLRGAIQLKQENEANLALDEGSKDAIEAAGIARVKSLADAARATQNYPLAEELDAEAAVQEKVNKAKRDGINLDPAKLKGYHDAMLAASAEADATAKIADAAKKNLDLVNATKDALEGAATARIQSYANAAKGPEGQDTAASIALEAEVAVQQKLNAAKRDGETLDADKVAAYRQAVQLAGVETATINQQEESRRQLQQIADDARKSMRDAISSGINDALAGKLSVSGLVKTFGDILRKQLSDEITQAIFQGGVNQSQVTMQAVQLVTPAAIALAAAAEKLAGAADPTSTSNPVASAADAGAAQLTAASTALAAGISAGAAPVGSAVSRLVASLGVGTKAGSGSAFEQTGLGKVLGPTGVLGKGLNSLAGFLGVKSKTDDKGKVTSAGSSLLNKLGSGLAIGNASAGLLGLFGVKTSSTGSSLGGMAGSLIGGPFGAAIGGALGGIIGNLFKKTQKSSATITNVDEVVTGTGTTKALATAATGMAAQVQAGIKDIAKTLNATVGAFNVSIGSYKDDIRVNENGKALGGVTGSGATGFGDDSASAVQYAIELAIKQGAIKGLSEGISEALQSGSATVQEVADFAASKKDIDNKAKALTDPVGAAIDLLDDQFNDLRAQYAKFGEDTTNLEKVYQDQRLKTIADATSKELDTLKQFRIDLNSTDLGGRSVSDEVAYQDAALKQIEAASAAGKPVDSDQLNTVGRALLDATQQLEGNTPAYQAQVDRVMALLNKVIGDGGDSNVSVLQPGTPTVDTSGIITATDATTQAVSDQTDAVVGAVNNVGAAIVRMSGALSAKLDAVGGGDYEDTGSNFKVAAF